MNSEFSICVIDHSETTSRIDRTNLGLDLAHDAFSSMDPSDTNDAVSLLKQVSKG